MLKITNLHVGLEEEDKAILKGVDLSVGSRGGACNHGPETGQGNRRCPMFWQAGTDMK